MAKRPRAVRPARGDALREFGDATVPPEIVYEQMRFYGELLRVTQQVSELAVVELGALAEAGEDSETVRAAGVIRGLLAEIVHPEDWAKFRGVCSRFRLDGEKLAEFAMTVVRDDLPTVRPSVSSDGPLSTDSRSKDVSPPGGAASVA